MHSMHSLAPDSLCVCVCSVRRCHPPDFWLEIYAISAVNMPMINCRTFDNNSERFIRRFLIFSSPSDTSPVVHAGKNEQNKIFRKMINDIGYRNDIFRTYEAHSRQFRVDLTIWCMLRGLRAGQRQPIKMDLVRAPDAASKTLDCHIHDIVFIASGKEMAVSIAAVTSISFTNSSIYNSSLGLPRRTNEWKNTKYSVESILNGRPALSRQPVPLERRADEKSICDICWRSRYVRAAFTFRCIENMKRFLEPYESSIQHVDDRLHKNK